MGKAQNRVRELGNIPGACAQGGFCGGGEDRSSPRGPGAEIIRPGGGDDPVLGAGGNLRRGEQLQITHNT